MKDAPYRNDIDALRERKESLEREREKLREQTRDLEALRARELEIEKELAGIEGRLGRRSLPLLDRVRVASPCNASWDEMLGDERARFCLSCEKHVYNVSAMSRDEAEQFLRERVGQSVCIRYYQRADGTILTEDCPVGAAKKRRKQAVLAVAGAGAMALAGISLFDKARCATETAVAGEMVIEPPVQGGVTMGDWAGPDEPDPEPPEPPPPPPTKPVMGRIKAR